MKTIGVLTSGGDAPGMNACIVAIAELVEKCGIHLRGIFRGFKGLLEANSIPIGTELSGLARRGGSFLGTSRNGDIETALKQQGLAKTLENCCVDGLIVLGGGGSLEASAQLASEGASIIGIPCTIDNDVYGTDYSIGFDSAVNKALRAADEIMDTAESLSERVFVIETLGGKTGHIALSAAYAASADAVFIHEVQPDYQAITTEIKARMDDGATHGLVIICEGLGTEEIIRRLESGTGRRARFTSLGHTQRGGNPTFIDRRIAREFGEKAVEMLLSGETGKMVAQLNGSIGSIPLSKIAGKSRPIDMAKYRAVNG